MKKLLLVRMALLMLALSPLQMKHAFSQTDSTTTPIAEVKDREEGSGEKEERKTSKKELPVLLVCLLIVLTSVLIYNVRSK